MDDARRNTSQVRRSVAEDDATRNKIVAEILIIGDDPDTARTGGAGETAPGGGQPLPGRFRSRSRTTLGPTLAALTAAGAVLAALALAAYASGSEWQLCPDPGSAQANLRQLTEAENQALVAADTASLDTLLAGDFTLVTPGGDFLSRADLIASIGSGDLDFRSIRIVDSRPQDAFVVRLDCNSATVRYRSDIDVATALVHYRHHAYHTDTWTRTGNGWKQIQAHTTAVGGFPPPGQ